MAHPGKLMLLAAILLAASAVPVWAQGTPASASSSFTVSVTVVRSCAVSTPTALTPATTAVDVRLSCGRSPSTASVRSGGIVPVSGVAVPASVSTSKNDTGLVVSVNF